MRKLIFIFSFLTLFTWFATSDAHAVRVGIDGRRDKVDTIGASDESKQNHWVNFYIYNGLENRKCTQVNSGLTGGYNTGDIAMKYVTSGFRIDGGLLQNAQSDYLNLIPTVNFDKCKDENGNEFSLDQGDQISFNMYRQDDDGVKLVASSIAPKPIGNPGTGNYFDQIMFQPQDIQIQTEAESDEERRAKKNAEIEKDRAAGVAPSQSPGSGVYGAGQAIFGSGGGGSTASEKVGSALTVPQTLVAGMSTDPAYAGCDTSKRQISTAIGCISATPLGLVEAVLNIAIGVAGGLAFLLMVYGSFVLVTSGGNADNVTRGRTVITSAIAGLMVILLSVFILRLFGLSILQLPAFVRPNLAEEGAKLNKPADTNITETPGGPK